MVDVLPGVTVQVAAQALPSGDATDTGRLHVVGVTRKGPVEPTVVTGTSSFERTFGARTHFDTLTDPLQAFFTAGGGQVVVSRVVGAGAQAASATIEDGESTPTLEVEAAWPGEAGDDLSVEVAHDGSRFTLTVFDDGEQVERFVEIESPADAVDATSQSRFIRVSDLGSASADPTPAEGASQLSGGDDDRGNIDDQQWEDALDRIGPEWGPGQVAAPSRTSSTAHSQLIAHAEATNRVAFLDGDQGAGNAQLLSAVDSARSRSAALFAPWIQVSIGGRIRTVPASMIAAAVAARLDQAEPSAGAAPTLALAGLPSVLDVDVDFDDDQHGELNGAGVNIFRSGRFGVLLRGWRSTSNEATWEQLNQVRYIMGLSARLADISERFVFANLSAATISEYGAQLSGELLDDFNAGVLAGDDADEAFTVDVSSDVNPVEQLAQGILSAAVSVTPAPAAERIVIQIVKRNLS